jgi:hypothetical protein
VKEEYQNAREKADEEKNARSDGQPLDATGMPGAIESNDDRGVEREGYEDE